MNVYNPAELGLKDERYPAVYEFIKNHAPDDVKRAWNGLIWDFGWHYAGHSKYGKMVGDIQHTVDERNYPK